MKGINIKYEKRSNTVNNNKNNSNSIVISEDYIKDSNYQVCTFDIIYSIQCPTGANEITPDNGVGPASNWVWQDNPAEMVTGLRFGLLGAYCPGNARENAKWATSGTYYGISTSGTRITAGSAITANTVRARYDSRYAIKLARAIGWLHLLRRRPFQ